MLSEDRAGKGLGSEMGKDTSLQKPWGSDCTERIANFGKVKKGKAEDVVSEVGLQYSCSGTNNQGGSGDLGCESCSAENLMHRYCPHHKLFLKMGLRLNLGKSKDFFQCSGNISCCSGLVVGEICYLLTRGLGEGKCMLGVRMQGDGLFLWKTCASKLKYKTEKHSNCVSLAIV